MMNLHPLRWTRARRPERFLSEMSEEEKKPEEEENPPEEEEIQEPHKRRFDPEKLGSLPDEDREDDAIYVDDMYGDWFLDYASYVILERAVPHADDGLKPVQRRILYAMYHNLHLHPESRYRKSAAVIGEVMAKYHPHGDQSIYDAMVRMAQPFSLLHTLVDGQGNYGSLDGDPPAAMRYTEARLAKIAIELLQELKKQTVHYRANYDGQFFEPVVLPARFPQILINGTEGIAVGMATKIPPHNLREVIDACVLIIDDPEVSLRKLCLISHVDSRRRTSKRQRPPCSRACARSMRLRVSSLPFHTLTTASASGPVAAVSCSGGKSRAAMLSMSEPSFQNLGQ